MKYVALSVAALALLFGISIALTRYPDCAIADESATFAPSNDSTDANSTATHGENLEEDLRTVLRDLWSFRVDDDTLYLTLDVPSSTTVPGLDYFKYGFEVYSLGTPSCGSGRFYKEGGQAIDGRTRIKSDSPHSLDGLRKLLGVTDKPQRGLVIRFWAGTRESKVR